MMKLSLPILLCASTAVSAFDSTTGQYGALDTNRAPRFFEPPKQARKGGFKYVDELALSMDAEMDMEGGMALKASFAAVGDTEMDVTAQEGGNVQIDIYVQNVKADLSSFLMSFHCDSNDRSHSDPDCAELFAAVGEKETMVVDKEGNLLEMTTIDGQTINVAAMEAEEASVPEVPSMNLASKFEANKLAAAHHFDKSQQMLKLIPDHAVRPGDSWIDDLDLDTMGTFKGTSSLKGYTEYEGADCAVFYFQGSLHLDVSQIAVAIGADPSMLPPNMTYADAVITNDILWDPQDQIARWMQWNISTALDIPNPMMPDSGEQVHIPVNVTFSIATDILERGPDSGDNNNNNPGASESSVAYQAPAYSSTTSSSSSSSSSSEYSSESKSSSGGGGGGAFKGIFFVILVGAAAAGGFMMYKKRQDGFQFHRPNYEFSSVGMEPIHGHEPMV